METSLKTGFAQIFSRCPKNLSCPKFGGAAAPLAPPARTPMVPSHSILSYVFRVTNVSNLIREFYCKTQYVCIYLNLKQTVGAKTFFHA